MPHLASRSLCVQVSSFQLEVPLGGTVGVIDQHEMRIVLQAFRLLLHGPAILLHELCENELQQFGS